MTIDQLREAIATMPGHWPVHVAVGADGSGGGGDTDYLYTLDIVRDNFPTQGNCAVIRIDYASPSDIEAAWLRKQRAYPKRPDIAKGETPITNSGASCEAAEGTPASSGSNEQTPKES